MKHVDFTAIVEHAWMEYDNSRKVKEITDISVKVSTNHVYKIVLEDRHFVIAKLSYFGNYDDFAEDHTIINVLSNNLPYPFETFLSRSLMKGNNLFIHRFTNDEIDAAVVFYRPVKIKLRPPKRLSENQIVKLGKQVAKFHKACHIIRHTLPPSSKSLKKDIGLIKEFVQFDQSIVTSQESQQLVLEQCDSYLSEVNQLDLDDDRLIPLFIDWNIGNFSVTLSFRLFSRWDYDWFRTTTRVMDFYFLSRVVSDVGDQTAFTYNVSTLQEDRFLLFLKSYHSVFPLSHDEVLMIREAYRFFILNYVIRHGAYFFNEPYSSQLRKDALRTHLKSIVNLDMVRLLQALKI